MEGSDGIEGEGEDGLRGQEGQEDEPEAGQERSNDDGSSAGPKVHIRKRKQVRMW